MMSQENIPMKVGLLELLYGSQGTQFVIPAYQRNYTWTANNEVKQLLDDINVVLRGERTKHFNIFGNKYFSISAGTFGYRWSAKINYHFSNIVCYKGAYDRKRYEC